MNSQLPSLQIQSVIYENDLSNVEKLVLSLKQSATLAIEKGIVKKITYRLGDASPKPLIADSDSWCQKYTDDTFTVSYQYFDENLGHGGGQNRLAQNSKADIIGIINPDVIVSPRLISILCGEFKDPTVGIAEAAQIPMEHPKDYDLATRETSFASGCCLFINRMLFEKVSGFDDKSFFMYCDDVDLSWRVRLESKKIIFCPEAVVYHDHRIDNDSKLEIGEAEFYYSAIGGILLAYKWGRHDLVEKNLAYMKTESKYKKVVDEFEELEKAGELPSVIANAEKVRVFSPTGFAQYRWTN